MEAIIVGGLQLSGANKPVVPNAAKPSFVRNTNELGPNRHRPKLTAAVDIRTAFYSGYSKPLRILMRNGAEFIVPKMFNRDEAHGRLIVSQQYSKAGTVNLNLDTSSHDDDVTPPSAERAAVIKSNQYADSSFAGNMSPLWLDYVIEESLLLSKPQGVYIPELDVVLSFDMEVNLIHPRSECGMMLAGIDAGSHLDTGFSFGIDIVDPDKLFGCRFVNVDGEVHLIRPTETRDRAPGVYYWRRTGDGQANLVSEFATFDKADEKFRLYMTSADAKVFGDIAGERKKELEEATHQAKADTIRMKADLDRLEHLLVMAKLKEEQHQQEMEFLKSRIKHDLEMKSMAAKDHYESRSHVRKDWTEWLKWIPTAVIGIGIVVKLIVDAKAGPAKLAMNAVGWLGKLFW